MESERDWIGLVLNLLFFPVFLSFELVHYGMFREWYSFTPGELWEEVVRHV